MVYVHNSQPTHEDPRNSFHLIRETSYKPGTGGKQDRVEGHSWEAKGKERGGLECKVLAAALGGRGGTAPSAQENTEAYSGSVPCQSSWQW